MNWKKKGLSAIVSNVIIVALTIVAILIIAGFAVPFVKDNLNKGSECIDYQNYFSFNRELDYNCQEGGANYLFSVSTSSDKNFAENVRGLKIVFRGTDKSKAVEVTKERMDSSLKVLGNIQEKIPKSGETYTYNYTANEDYDSAEIYVVLNSGRTCEASNDKIIFGECR